MALEPLELLALREEPFYLPPLFRVEGFALRPRFFFALEHKKNNKLLCFLLAIFRQLWFPVVTLVTLKRIQKVQKIQKLKKIQKKSEKPKKPKKNTEKREKKKIKNQENL